MRLIIAPLLVAFAVLSTPAYAQEGEDRPAARGGGKGALIGLLVGAGAAVVYGLTTDYCRNPVGEYTEGDKAKFCAAPIAAMIGTGAAAGYFLGRHRAEPESRSRGAARPDNLAATVPPIPLKAPARAARPEDRFFRRLFTAAE